MMALYANGPGFTEFVISCFLLLVFKAMIRVDAVKVPSKIFYVLFELTLDHCEI